MAAAQNAHRAYTKTQSRLWTALLLAWIASVGTLAACVVFKTAAHSAAVAAQAVSLAAPGGHSLSPAQLVQVAVPAGAAAVCTAALAFGRTAAYNGELPQSVEGLNIAQPKHWEALATSGATHFVIIISKCMADGAAAMMPDCGQHREWLDWWGEALTEHHNQNVEVIDVAGRVCACCRAVDPHQCLDYTTGEHSLRDFVIPLVVWAVSDCGGIVLRVVTNNVENTPHKLALILAAVGTVVAAPHYWFLAHHGFAAMATMLVALGIPSAATMISAAAMATWVARYSRRGRLRKFFADLAKLYFSSKDLALMAVTALQARGMVYEQPFLDSHGTWTIVRVTSSSRGIFYGAIFFSYDAVEATWGLLKGSRPAPSTRVLAVS
jgi:hypothetical protein